MSVPFSPSEYQARISAVKARMSEAGVDTLVVADPANMNYLTGYNAWSFYTPQCVIVGHKLEEPLCIVRGMDANGARATTFLTQKSIIGYPDHYVQAKDKHAMDYVADLMKSNGMDHGRIGYESDTFYFTPLACATLQRNLPNAKWIDCNLLVNWVRAVKSPQEIEYMQQAALIMERMMAVAIDAIEPGTRQCDAVAQLYHAQISGTPEFGGDYAAFVPMIPTGVGTSTPHLTWSDEPFKTGEATILELGAARHRYHCPLARTVFLGKAPAKMTDTAKVVIEGLAAAVEAAKPGATCEQVEAAWRRAIEKSGIKKESRIGYSIGLNYPPDWGEHTMSLRPGDQTVLVPNMTLHCIPGIWMDDWGIEISEPIRITDKGAVLFCDVPQDLTIKN